MSASGCLTFVSTLCSTLRTLNTVLTLRFWVPCTTNRSGGGRPRSQVWTRSSYLDDGVQVLPRCGRRVDDRRRAHGHHGDVMGQDRLSRCRDDDGGVMRRRRRRHRGQDLWGDEQSSIRRSLGGGEGSEKSNIYVFPFFSANFALFNFCF